jgi:hypothetical protein
MGGDKATFEMICHPEALQQSGDTRFEMVRFQQ